MKKLKDNKVTFVLVCISLFFILLGIAMVSIGAPKALVNPRTVSEKKVSKIICKYLYSDENSKITVELELKDRKLITKTTTTEWVGEKYQKKDCAYFKGVAAQFDVIEGISDKVQCDNTGGVRVITFTLADYKSDIVRLSEEQYINEKGIFSHKDWINHMTDEYYSCITE